MGNAMNMIDMARDERKIFAELASFLPHAASLASVPVSGYRVGAAALTPGGRVYFGANQEFEGLPLNLTVHAEQAAVLNARAHGERELFALAVSSPPCGYCRQFLLELGAPLKIVANGAAVGLDSLLPQGFMLGAGSLLARARSLEGLDAREAAELSYSPYTSTKSGLALRCASGAVFSGCLLESGAYNPSLTSLQSALTMKALADDTSAVIEAVLCESGPAPVAPLLRAFLSHVSPGVKIHMESYS